MKDYSQELKNVRADGEPAPEEEEEEEEAVACNTQ